MIVDLLRQAGADVTVASVEETLMVRAIQSSVLLVPKSNYESTRLYFSNLQNRIGMLSTVNSFVGGLAPKITHSIAETNQISESFICQQRLFM